MNARIMEIRAQLEREKDSTKRKAFERRIAEFSGGKATLYIDAKTAAEKYYLKLKAQDCVNSCKSALEGGVVRGGGLALKEVADSLEQPSLLSEALTAPYRRIQQNAGGTLEIGNEVMDSYLCVRAGVENAVSVVKVVISLEGIIADVIPSLLDELREKINQ